ncbi:fimbrial protein [Paraburkholderia madseniana]|uniref:fimbrial protein n=1 Tax=Paraburkholderia TaxID=1822464 RepID=UPI0039C8D4C5
MQCDYTFCYAAAAYRVSKQSSLWTGWGNFVQPWRQLPFRGQGLCDANDASNVSNTSSTLSLTPDSTAKGVGLQILNGTTPIAYGPDSPVAGKMNQWSAGMAAGGTMNIRLTALYIRTTVPLTPGTIKGVATFTMAYQ